jgi:hypothetical protein
VAGYQPAREAYIKEVTPQWIHFRYWVLLSFRDSVYYDHQKHVTLILLHCLRQRSFLYGFPYSLFDFNWFKTNLILWERYLPEKVSFFLGRVMGCRPGMLTRHSAPVP